MKKIVALALCLIMALSLATVAFAAGHPATTGLVDNSETGKTYKLEKVQEANAALKTFDVYNLYTTTTADGSVVSNQYVIAADATSADIAFVDGTSVTYLANYVAGNTKYAKVATKVATVDCEDVENCGEYFVKGDVAVYTVDNKYYVAGGATIFSVDGKYVECTEVTDTVKVKTDDVNAAYLNAMTEGVLYVTKHDYTMSTSTAAAKITCTGVSCKYCKATFDFVAGSPADAIAKFGDGNFTKADNLTVTAGDVYVKTAAAAAGTTTTAVSSAKTFDAGIALYVGMSISAVAGSAVVIGKKKEF